MMTEDETVKKFCEVTGLDGASLTRFAMKGFLQKAIHCKSMSGCCKEAGLSEEADFYAMQSAIAYELYGKGLGVYPITEDEENGVEAP